MKKTTILFLFLAGLIISSCKKSYTCDCVLTNNHTGTAPDSTYTRNYKNASTAYDSKMTEKQAKAACDHEAESIISNYNSANAAFYAQVSSLPLPKANPNDHYSATCTLK